MTSTDISREYPKHWIFRKLGEVCKTVAGGTPSRAIEDYWGGSIPWLKISDLNDSVITESSEFITEKGLKNSSARLLPKGTVLLAIYAGASVGKAGILGIESATNQAIVAISPDSNIINPNFLLLFLISKRKELQEKTFGGVQGNISHRIVKDIQLPIPPIEEQELIVTALNMARRTLESTKQELSRVPSLTRRLRTAILSKAFRGELSQPSYHIKRQSFHFISPSQFGDRRIHTIPCSWSIMKVEDFCDISAGKARTPENRSKKHPLKYLRVANVFQDRFELEDLKEMDFPPEELENYRLKFGDIILVGDQSPEHLGRCAIWQDQIPDVGFQNHLIRIRCESIEPEFVKLYIEWAKNNGVYSGMSTQGVNLAHMRISEFRKLQIPIPQVKERKLIVERINRYCSLIESLRAHTLRADDSLANLESSILKAAFDGCSIDSTAIDIGG